ncbi:hypothetical protein KBC04_04145 [Candidatus Babeliales bacterium]|nr:hypothetical protein [Candidatus Babeliales bacterium]MBP9843312.1 hypothetical protein [Candidatus Babeliales bacterium]
MKKSKLFFILVFCFSFVERQVEATYLPQVGMGFTGLISFFLLKQYVDTNYLVQEKHLVATDYAYAQMWYDAMVIKYPDAHLSQKLFLQNWRTIDLKAINHCSSFSHIYFPQESLKTINDLYKKTVDGENLTQEEQVYLGKEEFMLLYLTAHIEHQDIANYCYYKVAILSGLTALAYIYASTSVPTQAIGFLKDRYNMSDVKATWMHDYLLFILGVAVYGKIFNNLAYEHEVAADKFVCDHADINALEGGITFFEDKKIDTLITIENETVSPFIPVESELGMKIQYLVKIYEKTFLEYLQNIKKDPVARRIYDTERDPIHQNPSVRAQLIREEIARRVQQTQAGATE